jgi:hypothetical protein
MSEKGISPWRNTVMNTYLRRAFMAGHEEPNGRARDLRLSPSLTELLTHISSHTKESSDELGSLALILGLAEIVQAAQLSCLAIHLLRFLTEQGENYGIKPETWEMFDHRAHVN